MAVAERITARMAPIEMGMHPAGVISMFEAQIKQVGPMTVAFLVMHGAYDQAGEGFARLYTLVGRYGLQPAGMPAALYLTMPDTTPESEALWELWAPIAPGPGLVEPGDEDGFGVKRIEGATVASTMYRGPYEGIAPTYEQLTAWIAEQGARAVGPPREIYYSDPKDVSPDEYLTEVQFPVIVG
jgi:effector-binding domain-containing protein